MLRTSRLAAALLCLVLVAARPLPDLHKWDNYFALFARDSTVPWKVATVRLDTYSGAPVDFAVYAVDPADVIVAGANALPRTVNTARLKPVARWKFTPGAGYRFDSNEVSLPLGAREGFFVVEARRNAVAEQVWVNRTRVGLLTKEAAGEVLLYGADLGTGHALSHMRINFLVNGSFVTRYTDAHGIVRWKDRPRPLFAMAQYGNSRAFISLLPQAPVPSSIAGVVLDSAVVRAGEDVRVVGFARTRSGASFTAAAGTARISLQRGATPVADERVAFDRSGVASATLRVPENTPEGDYAVLLSGGGASAGTTLHVDGAAGGVALTIRTGCPAACLATADVPIIIEARRSDAPAAQLPLHIDVVRSPHVFSGETRNKPWGVTPLVSQDIVTADDGTARIAIAHPTDELGSTYGVHVSAGGASAATRIVVPTASAALDLQVERTEESAGNAIAFDVRGASIVDGKPLAGVPVRVRLVHGASAQEQTVTLDSTGRARGSFSSPELGANLILARASAGGADTLDAQEVQVQPQSTGPESGTQSAAVGVSFDRASYVAGSTIGVGAVSSGSAGDALLTYETPAGIQATVTPVRDGRAQATFTARNAAGNISVGAAFVHDGTLRWNAAPVALAGAGRAQNAGARIEGDTFAPGSSATLKIDEGSNADRTVILRMTYGTPSGAARFDGTPGLLAIGQAASQDTAPPEASWHAWVDATATHASDPASVGPQSAPPDDVTIADAQTRPVYWNVLRTGSGPVTIPMPGRSGAYTLSILEFGDDGHIAAASQSITIK